MPQPPSDPTNGTTAQTASSSASSASVSSESSTGGWASGSFAVVIAVNGTSVHVLDRVPVWDLAGLRHGGTAEGNRLSNPNVVAYSPIDDTRIRDTQAGVRYQVRRGAPIAREQGETKKRTEKLAKARLAALPPGAQDKDRAAWWSVSAIELFAFETPHDRVTATQAADAADVGADVGDAVTYVVLHLIAKPAGLRAIVEAVSYFSHPTGATTHTRPRWPARHLDTLLHELGFPRGMTYARPYVITHLVPDESGVHGPVPDADAELVGASARGWTSEQIWAWRLAAGPNLSVDAEPGWDPKTATQGGFWSGSTWCRVNRNGAAFVATRALNELPAAGDDEGQVWWRDASRDERRRQYIEHVRLEAFTHRHAVDLTILAMRQTRFLDAHATRLARTFALPARSAADQARLATAVDVSEQRYRQLEVARTRALAMELSLVEFRNDLWFANVLGEPDVSAAMAALHDALGSNALLADIDAEQQDITRVLGLASQEAAATLAAAQHAAAVAAQITAELAAQNLEATEKILQARRETLDKVITFAAPVVAVPGVVFAFIQVYQAAEGGRRELWWGVSTIAVLCLIAWAVLYGLLVRKTETTDSTSAGTPAGPPTGTSRATGVSADNPPAGPDGSAT